MESKKISLLYPFGEDDFKPLSEVSLHDLGVDFICQTLTDKVEEQNLFLQIFSRMTDNPAVSKYRLEVFQDIYENPQMCNNLIKVLEHINYEKQFSNFSGHFEGTDSAWELLHQLEQINDYILSVETMYEHLCKVELKSEGMKKLKNHISQIYNENGFEELKKDIKNLKATTSDLQSITVGINLNEKFEAHGIGLLSFNKKPFTKSSVIGELCTKVAPKDNIQDEAEWNKSFKYHPISANGMTKDFFENLISIANVNDPRSENVTYYMDKIANLFIGNIVHKLKTVLKKYVYIPITDITSLIPEFIFYIRFANFIKQMQEKGFTFCKPQISSSDDYSFMDAKGIYNFKLVSAFNQTMTAKQIVPNNLDFSQKHCTYILTGANRGGKTTITQAIGLLFVLAQAGLYIPGTSFVFNPVDSIYTHFPADEDKTMDLGRLGEECKRFKELFNQATKTSLMLLNETYSTTSFEEGFYIAKDSVKAILAKGIRTIYNTHMHKLAFDVEEINASSSQAKATSLIVKAQDGQRSFKVEVAPPQGVSFAKDIAVKYGVTLDQLLKGDEQTAE